MIPECTPERRRGIMKSWRRYKGGIKGAEQWLIEKIPELVKEIERLEEVIASEQKGGE